jgi:DNA-binding IclR family transcriptional regulator
MSIVSNHGQHSRERRRVPLTLTAAGRVLVACVSPRCRMSLSLAVVQWVALRCCGATSCSATPRSC